MRPFAPLSNKELAALAKAAEVIRSQTAVPCTECGYCTSHCPIGMPIPQYFALYNDYARNPGEDWKMQYAYDALAKKYVKASECIGCKQCENNCPQKISITKYLGKCKEAFEG